MKPRLQVVTAVFKRRLLTEFVLRYWADLKRLLEDDIELDLWAALSPDDPHLSEFEEICLEIGWNYAVVENQPLWAKWNALLHSMKSSIPVQQTTGMLVMGSDDIANQAFVRGIAALLQSGVDYIQPTGCVMFHPETGRMSFLSAFQGGAGRAFSTRLCESLKWEVWRDNPDLKSVDLWQDLMVKEKIEQVQDFRRSQFPITIFSEWQMMDIKTSGGKNMWDWEQFSPNVNVLTQWLEAEGTLEEAFPGYFEPTEEEVAHESS